MKKFLMAVAALACMGTVALAGPNAGGTLFVHDANLVFTVDNTGYCGLGSAPASCLGADATVNGAHSNAQAVFKVYAAFPDGSSPRLKALAFGVVYDAVIIIGGFGPCAEFELPDSGWPNSGTGNSIVWNTTQTTQIVEAYWFAGYNYYGNPGMFAAAPNPGQGGNFADDSVPSILDPIAGYGTLGFDMPGAPACPPPPVEGACCIGQDCFILTQSACEGQGGTFVGGPCDPNPCQQPLGACCRGEVCEITTEAGCEGGEWQGPGSTCDPNPCIIPNPTENSTWGSIKNTYR